MSLATVDKKISLLSKMGEVFRRFNLGTAYEQIEKQNHWFVPESVDLAIQAWSNALMPEKISHWANSYPELKSPHPPAEVLVIMAGNIPLVGLHDLLCVLLSGNKALVKLSSKDNVLIPLLIDELAKDHPEIKAQMTYVHHLPDHPDAVITSSSDRNRAFFENQFTQTPGIFRGNRNSVALLSGHESPTDLQNLSSDILSYFGLGCRNVSFLLVQKEDTLHQLINELQTSTHSIRHTGYLNNLKQHRAVLEMNRTHFLDATVCLMKEGSDVNTPMGVINYQYANSKEQIHNFLNAEKENIQCVVGQSSDPAHPFIPFGRSQYPELWEYADQIDTIQFLLNLNQI